MVTKSSSVLSRAIQNPAGQLWRSLVVPHPLLLGTDRQQAQLLLSLLVASFPWLLTLGMLDIVFQRDRFLIGYVFFDLSLPVLILIAYCVGRTRHYRIGSWLVVLAPALVISILVFILNPADVGVFVLYYLVFCPLLASLLLSVRATLVVALVNLVIVFAGIGFVEHWHLINMLDEILYNILVPILLVVSAVIRQQYINQLQQAEQSARIARDEAERSNKVKSTFLASMSHDLRTPLNAILNFTEFLSLKMLGDVNEEQEDALSKIYVSGKHLLELINDVLDIAKIEAGALQLFFENDVNLNHEMTIVVASAQALVKDKAVKFVTDIDADLPSVTCDRRRIKQVVLNLLSNAAKFTQEGSITLSIKNRPDHILFVVSDTGVGISREEQSVIFEPFKQSETGVRYGNGTGLGLPISKRIIEAHGGKVWLESEENEGTNIFATLPTQIKTASNRYSETARSQND